MDSVFTAYKQEKELPEDSTALYEISKRITELCGKDYILANLKRDLAIYVLQMFKAGQKIGHMNDLKIGDVVEYTIFDKSKGKGVICDPFECKKETAETKLYYLSVNKVLVQSMVDDQLTSFKFWTNRNGLKLFTQ